MLRLDNSAFSEVLAVLGTCIGEAWVVLLGDYLEFLVAFLDPPASQVIADEEEIPVHGDVATGMVDVDCAADVHRDLVYALYYQGIARSVETVPVPFLSGDLDIEYYAVEVVVAVDSEEA